MEKTISRILKKLLLAVVTVLLVGLLLILVRNVEVWTPAEILALTAMLLFFGIFSSRLSSRFNVPVLLLFLGAGMLIGSDRGLDFQNNIQNIQFANMVGTLAMAFILYSGGLETDTKSIRRVLLPGALLSSLGVLLTAVVLGLCASFLLNWSWQWGVLLGCIVSSTDAAAVFAILRSKAVSLKGNLAPVLELESGSNDPMAALLTIFMVSFLKEPAAQPLWQFPLYFAGKMAIGLVMGYAIGRFGCWVFNRAKLEYEGLYFVLGVAVVLLSYGLTECAWGNGFMGAYCCGLTMGRRRYNYKKGQLRFNNGLAWLMQVAMFMVLGMLVTPRQFQMHPDGWHVPVWGAGVALALCLIFLARPVGVFLCLIRSKFSIRERILIAWVGLRGAAPIVLATFPLAAHLAGDHHYPESYVDATGMVVNASIDQNLMLFNLVFAMVIASVLIQGTTLMPLAKLLKLDSPLKDRERIPLELEETGVINSVMHEFEVTEQSRCLNRTLAELNLPSGLLVMLVRRGGSFILARGNTRIELHDGLLLMGEEPLMNKFSEEFFPGSDYGDE